jgi:hypothetical protein
LEDDFMRAAFLPSFVLVFGLIGSGPALSQNAGHSPDGQVPGPNATPPQADSQSSDGTTSVQPVPGAMPGSDTVPSLMSEKNAAGDRLLTVAYTFKSLNDEQRRAVYQGLKGKPTSGAGPNVALGVELPFGLELRAVPQEILSAVPQTSGYQYVVSGDKVFLVAPSNRVVVGEFTG